jgi:PAS domain S-box-containing protein
MPVEVGITMNGAAPSGKRVLIVDDDPVQLKLSAMLLAQAGFDVQTAAGAADALDLARQNRPDAIISDVVMGDLDGFTLCSLFRGDPALGSVPIILASAHFGEEEDRRLATLAGATTLVERTPMFHAEIAALRRVLDQAPLPPAPTQPMLPEHYVRRMARQMSQLVTRSKAAELRYRTLFDNANEAISVLTPDGRILEVNHYWETLVQLPRNEIVGHHIAEFAAPGHEHSNVSQYLETVNAQERKAPIYPITRRDGSTVYVEISVTVVDIDGETAVFSIGRDVTDMLEARRSLEVSERKHRSLVEQIPDVVWVASPDGRVIYLSPQVEAICGFAPEELLGSVWFERMHADDVERVRRLSGAAGPGGYEAEYRWRRHDGQWIWIRSRGRAAVDADGKAVVEGTFTEVTRQKSLEEQVRQSQKMEAIGQLTGGIAHDFNNMLAVILGNGRMLLDDLNEGDPRREDAEAIIDAADRAAALTRQLLTFSRRQVVQPTPLNLNHVVRGIEKMLRRVIGEDIDLSIGVPDDLGTVVADASGIEQVIMNLVVNARDAMPGGGRLIIETSNVTLDEECAAMHVDATPGAHVMLAVTDTGSGMDAETRRRAFEPFFTTKPQGMGTGLGLSTCYGIVREARGHIAIYSEIGHGTVFKVYLPRIDAQRRAPAAVAASTAAGTGKETILLVEDDAQLRRTIHKILASLGYRVLDSSNGEEALSVCQSHDGPVDLILSDMVMPGLSGPEVVNLVKAYSPAARALFMSGYTDHALLRSGTGLVGVNFIQKPFTPQALGAKVRGVLDGR